MQTATEKQKEIQEKLITENIPLVYFLLKRLNVSYDEYEDLASVGSLGLVKAAKTYDNSKQASFSTYAGRCINNEFFMYFRKNKFYSSMISLNETVKSSEDLTELTLLDTISSDTEKNFVDKIAEDELFVNVMNIILNILDCKSKIAMLYDFSGFSQKYISEILNISQSYTSRLERSSLKKINYSFKYLKELNFNKTFEFSKDFDCQIYTININDSKIPDFDYFFAQFIRKLTFEESSSLKYFRKSSMTIIQIPAHPDFLYLIAKLIQEIEKIL